MQKPRRIATALNDELKEEVRQMESQGIIAKEDGHTDWVSNIVMPKRNGKLRLCLDPLELNKALNHENTSYLRWMKLCQI